MHSTPKTTNTRAADADEVRLNHFLAQVGIASRRACDAIIAEGRVRLPALGDATDELVAGLVERRARLGRDLREARVDADERIEDDRPGGDPGERLVIGRDDVPRRPRRARLREDVAEGALVVVPVPPLPDVAR